MTTKPTFAELIALFGNPDVSNRSLDMTDKRREVILDALTIAAAGALPAIPHATDNEKRIVGKLVEDLLAAGFTLSVNDGEEITLRQSTDTAAIFAALGSTDSDHLIVHSQNVRDRWIRLIWGNDVDVISDYLTSLESYLAGANKLAEELDR